MIVLDGFGGLVVLLVAVCNQQVSERDARNLLDFDRQFGAWSTASNRKKAHITPIDAELCGQFGGRHLGTLEILSDALIFTSHGEAMLQSATCGVKHKVAMCNVIPTNLTGALHFVTVGVLFDRLIKEVQTKGLTHLELAQRMRISRPMVTQILNGTRGLTDVYIEKFCDALNLPLSEFLADVTERRVLTENDLYPNPEHADYHRMLQRVFQAKDEGATRTIDAVQMGIEGAYLRITGEVPPRIGGEVKGRRASALSKKRMA
jgi:transcriptional regulator with XRE-family HTH domain